MLLGVALFFTLIFTTLAVIGLVPGILYHQLFVSVFDVSFVFNLLHLMTGFFAAVVNIYPTYSRLYFKIVGFIYGLLAIFGFATDGNFKIFHINLPVCFFYVIVAVIALYVGFTSGVTSLDTKQTII